MNTIAYEENHYYEYLLEYCMFFDKTTDTWNGYGEHDSLADAAGATFDYKDDDERYDGTGDGCSAYSNGDGYGECKEVDEKSIMMISAFFDEIVIIKEIS